MNMNEVYSLLNFFQEYGYTASNVLFLMKFNQTIEWKYAAACWIMSCELSD